MDKFGKKPIHFAGCGSENVIVTLAENDLCFCD